MEGGEKMKGATTKHKETGKLISAEHKGRTWYLHEMKPRYYFSKNPHGALTKDKLPKGFRIKKTKRLSFPVLVRV